jgi:hypothetical protein
MTNFCVVKYGSVATARLFSDPFFQMFDSERAAKLKLKVLQAVSCGIALVVTRLVCQRCRSSRHHRPPSSPCVTRPSCGVLSALPFGQFLASLFAHYPPSRHRV